VGLGQTKDYKIGICCFSTKQAALMRKNKGGLAYVVDDKELIKEVLSIQLYHDENKLILNETMRSSLY
jgi:hypothetical protein